MTDQSSVETRIHHQFGPSRLEYIDHCAAYVNKNSENKDFAEQGQFLHDVMAEMISAVYIPGNFAGPGQHYPNTLSQLDGHIASKYEFTEEQTTWLRFCCRRCDDLIARKPYQILVETPIELKNPDGSLVNHGYLDVLFIFPSGVGILVDFKFGWIPVPPAPENLQGLNYALASLQMFPELQKIGVKFMQPKLNSVSETIITRETAVKHHLKIKQVIDRAIFVQENPAQAQTYMHPGPYCEYCSLVDSCAMLANHRGIVASRFGNLPSLPTTFPGMEIATPQQWALARYWVDVIERGLEDFKKRAKEVAEANGGELCCTLSTGEEVVYEIATRSTDRILGDTLEIAEALKEFVSYEEILSCADLGLTKLLRVAAKGIADVRAVEGGKLTKKKATELVESTLSALGLLSAPDTKIRFLKLRKGAKVVEDNAPLQQPKQIEITSA